MAPSSISPLCIMILFLTNSTFSTFTPRKIILFSTVPSIMHPLAINELDTFEEIAYSAGASCLILVKTSHESLKNDYEEFLGSRNSILLAW